MKKPYKPFTRLKESQQETERLERYIKTKALSNVRNHIYITVNFPLPRENQIHKKK